MAKHYGATVVACPPRRGNRKGAVECGVKFMCGRWWRTMTEVTPEAAQVSLDRFWSTTGDARLRPAGRYADAATLIDGVRPTWPTVGDLADAETLIGLPAMPFPATVTAKRTVDDRATLAFRGKRYSVNPGMGGADVTVGHRLGSGELDITTRAGTVLVTHHLAPGVGVARRSCALRSFTIRALSRSEGSRGGTRPVGLVPGPSCGLRGRGVER